MGVMWCSYFTVCPKGWVYYRNRCYLFSEEKATVKEAMVSKTNATPLDFFNRNHSIISVTKISLVIVGPGRRSACGTLEGEAPGNSWILQIL